MVVVVGSCDATTDPAVPIDPHDLDGDGIPNASDICPKRFDTTPEHDEDADGVGDACDNCPTVANADQADGGEGGLQFPDGVGDVCDPRPARAGDKLNKLFTFETDPSKALTGTGWTIANDRAVATGDALWSGVQAALGDGIAAQVRVPLLSWTAAVGDVTVVVDGDGVNFGLACSLVHDTDGDGFDEVVASVLRGESVRRSLGAPLIGEITIRAIRSVDVNRVATFRCQVTHAGVPFELRLTVEDTGSGDYLMAAHGASTEVTSFVVYTAPFNHGAP